MTRKNGILIFECVPKRERLNEGKMLYEFLRMLLDSDRTKFKRVTYPKDLLKSLGKNNFKYVHISTHGNSDKRGLYLELPKGKLYPEDFDGLSLKGNSISISGCELGKVDFCYKLNEMTGFEEIVAPQREISFEDSALFFINFFYLVFFMNNAPKRAWKVARNIFRIKGAVQYWSRI